MQTALAVQIQSVDNGLLPAHPPVRRSTNNRTTAGKARPARQPLDGTPGRPAMTDPCPATAIHYRKKRTPVLWPDPGPAHFPVPPTTPEHRVPWRNPLVPEHSPEPARQQPQPFAGAARGATVTGRLRRRGLPRLAWT